MSSFSMLATETATSYWCYSCSRFVRVWPGDPIACPDCNGGFVEEVSNPPPSVNGDVRRVDIVPRRSRRALLGSRSPFNPVIVFRSASSETTRPSDGSRFELYYDDGEGSGLRPLPQSMSDFLMGSGFDRLLDQLSQIESGSVSGVRSHENTPASKTAIETLPTITITSSHIAMESYCAVCKDPFEIGAEAHEMPCKHIFHRDCILPWLSLRNSCPVCRHELPTDAARVGDLPGRNLMGGEENTVGLTIWRLPGGGFAVGRFSGGRRAGERELPVVYTEMDGSFNSSGGPGRMSWPLRGSRSSQGRGFGRMFLNLFSIFGCFGSTSSSESSSRLRLSSASQTSRRSSWRDTTFSSRSWRLNGFSYEDGNRSDMARW